jgi:hypothetical protein
MKESRANDYLYENEIWKDAIGYEGNYQVSNMGRVKSLQRLIKRGHLNCERKVKERIKKVSLDKNGYIFLRLSKDGIKKNLFVHRIVASAFLNNDDCLPQVNHIDGNKENCRVENLEWVSQSENSKHAFKIGLRKPSGGAVKYKPIAQYTIDGVLICQYKSIRDAFIKTQINNISACLRNKTKYKTAGGYLWKQM